MQRQEQRENQDYRLNFRLNRACEVDVDELCGDVCSPFAGQACGGTVLRCLANKRSKVPRSPTSQPFTRPLAVCVRKPYPHRTVELVYGRMELVYGRSLCMVEKNSVVELR